MNAATKRPIEPTAVYTVTEAAALLTIHPVTLRKQLRAGVVKGKRTLGDWRMLGSELLRHA